MMCALPVVLMVALLWTPTRGLRLSPDRSQFSRWDSVDLDCENPDQILRRTTIRDRASICGDDRAPHKCSFRFIDPMDSGWYWCETKDGRILEGRNITVSDAALSPGPGEQTPPPASEIPPTGAQTPPPVSETPPTGAESPPPPPQRPLAVAVLCHLLVLSPYVASTVILLSVLRDRTGRQGRPVTAATSQTVAATRLDRRDDDITAVTTEHEF